MECSWKRKWRLERCPGPNPWTSLVLSWSSWCANVRGSWWSLQSVSKCPGLPALARCLQGMAIFWIFWTIFIYSTFFSWASKKKLYSTCFKAQVRSIAYDLYLRVDHQEAGYILRPTWIRMSSNSCIVRRESSALKKEAWCGKESISVIGRNC